MGSHAKPRTTGRKTALGALALGATLTGVGLTAAALDPATAVLAASGPDQGGATQLSGLSSPVADDLGPATGGANVLTPAPLGTVSALTKAATSGGAKSGTASGTTTSGTASSTSASSTAASAKPTSAGAHTVADEGSGAKTAVKPIKAKAPTSGSADASTAPAPGASSTSATDASDPSSTPAADSSDPSGDTGYVGRHAKTRSAAPPSAVTPLVDEVSGATSPAGSLMPLVQSLVGGVPLVGSLLGGTPLTGLL